VEFAKPIKFSLQQLINLPFDVNVLVNKFEVVHSKQERNLRLFHLFKKFLALSQFSHIIDFLQIMLLDNHLSDIIRLYLIALYIFLQILCFH
jgi:hypothetical protein